MKLFSRITQVLNASANCGIRCQNVGVFTTWCFRYSNWTLFDHRLPVCDDKVCFNRMHDINYVISKCKIHTCCSCCAFYTWTRCRTLDVAIAIGPVISYTGVTLKRRNWKRKTLNFCWVSNRWNFFTWIYGVQNCWND